MRQETPNIEEQRLPAARFRMVKCHVIRRPLSLLACHSIDTNQVSQYYDRDNIRWSSREKGHMSGIMKLMRYQDPETFAEPSQHQLFVHMRQNWVRDAILCLQTRNSHQSQISLSLERRRGTFLNSTEWRTKPWKGLRKTYSDTLWASLSMCKLNVRHTLTLYFHLCRMLSLEFHLYLRHGMS
jgi:hypothetical protein